jgi:hypothetical protein
MLKRILPLAFTILTAQSLLANDFERDGDFLSGLRGRSGGDTEMLYIRHQAAPVSCPKPTMAYYGKNGTVYYAYTVAPVRRYDPSALYAFGYPLAFFQSLTPLYGSGASLDQYAVESKRTNPQIEAGQMVAQSHRESTVTKVKAVTSTQKTQALPAIGEGPH